jgi:hypothetical protein
LKWHSLLTDAQSKAKQFFLDLTVSPLETSSLFDGLAELLVPDLSGPREAAFPRGRMQPFRIMFTLSRFTKQVEQEISLSPIESWGNFEGEHADETKGSRQVHPPSPHDNDCRREGLTVALPLHLADLALAANRPGTVFATPCFLFDPDQGIVGNDQGLVSIDEESKSLLKSLDSSLPLVLRYRVRRTSNGTHLLSVDSETPFECVSDPSANAMQAWGDTEAIPRHIHYSRYQHHAAMLIIRGRKCVLARERDPQGRARFLMPQKVHADPCRNLLECAVAAACEICEITADNMSVHPAMCSPVSYYPSATTIVHVFITIATEEPPGGVVRDLIEDELNDEDPYEWFSLASALKVLHTTEERDALEDIARIVKRAHRSGAYVPPFGLGVFGDVVCTHNTTQSEEARTPLWLVVSPFCDTVVARHWITAGSIETIDFTTDVDLLNGNITRAMRQCSIDTPGVAVMCNTEVVSAAALITDFLPLLQAQRGDVDIRLVVLVYPANEVCEAAMVPVGSLPHINGDNVVKLRNLCDALEVADAAMIPDAELGSTIADFLLSLSPAVHLCRSLPGHSPLTQETIERKTFALTFEVRLPFAPNKLAALFDPLQCADLLRSHSVQLLWATGYCWISTRFTYRGTVTVDDQKKCLRMEQGDPWWAVVNAEDRPDGIDESQWDRRHGDRTQQLLFVLLGDSSDDDPRGRLNGVLQSMLCQEKEWRIWHRLPDPLTPWK